VTDPAEPTWSDDLSVDELHEALKRAYRFRVPRALAEAVVATCGLDESDAFGFMWMFQHGRPFRSISEGYADFVPEFFTFGQPGTDGLSEGFVVYAPELVLDPLPVFEHDPVYGTVNLIGVDFRHALVNRAAWQPEQTDDFPYPDRSAAYEAVARLLDLPPVPMTTAPFGAPIPYVPTVPDEYLFVPVKDTIGVLAPIDTFGPDVDFERFNVHLWDPNERAALLHEFAVVCERLLLDGYSARVLLGIQRTYRDAAYGSVRVLDLWADAYDALGRTLIADVVRDAIASIERTLKRRGR
jgi:hypothetical protein